MGLALHVLSQAFPQRLLDNVQQLANQTANMTSPLNSFEGIIREVNISGMKADLGHITDFLTNAPTPKLLKAIIEDLDNALQVTLSKALDALKQEIDEGNNASSLNVLMGHIKVLQDFTIQPMRQGLTAYDDAIQAIKSQ